MIRKTVVTAMLTVVTAGAAWAEDTEARPRLEISGTAGWTWAEGVTGNGVKVAGVGTFDRINPNNSWSFGLRLGFMATKHLEFGGLANLQPADVHVLGTATVKVGDMTIRNYHGYFAYNFGAAKIRPYVLGGLGVTQYGSMTVTVANANRSISGQTKFSTTWGAGVKLFPAKHLGIRVEGRWTPTHIKPDTVGWWCDPYWGCYVVTNSQYSKQIEIAGGLTLRF